jgi:hypothetical protein
MWAMQVIAWASYEGSDTQVGELVMVSNPAGYSLTSNSCMPPHQQLCTKATHNTEDMYADLSLDLVFF